MAERDIKAQLANMLDRIRQLEVPDDQRGRLERLSRSTIDRQDRIEGLITTLQESLGSLSLQVKYLVCDLEATRRENAYLRRLLDGTARDQENQDREGDGNKPDDGRI